MSTSGEKSRLRQKMPRPSINGGNRTGGGPEQAGRIPAQRREVPSPAETEASPCTLNPRNLRQCIEMDVATMEHQIVLDNDRGDLKVVSWNRGAG